MGPSRRQLMLLLFLSVMLTQRTDAEGIKCFQCADCKETSSGQPQPCSSPEHVACSKAVMKNKEGDVVKVIRSCDTDADGRDQTCQKDDLGVERCLYYCDDTDGCNSASKSRFHSSLFAWSLVGANLLLIFLFFGGRGQNN